MYIKVIAYHRPSYSITIPYNASAKPNLDNLVTLRFLWQWFIDNLSNWSTMVAWAIVYWESVTWTIVHTQKMYEFSLSFYFHLTNLVSKQYHKFQMVFYIQWSYKINIKEKIKQMNKRHNKSDKSSSPALYQVSWLMALFICLQDCTGKCFMK